MCVNPREGGRHQRCFYLISRCLVWLKRSIKVAYIREKFAKKEWRISKRKWRSLCWRFDACISLQQSIDAKWQIGIHLMTCWFKYFTWRFTVQYKGWLSIGTQRSVALHSCCFIVTAMFFNKMTTFKCVFQFKDIQITLNNLWIAVRIAKLKQWKQVGHIDGPSVKRAAFLIGKWVSDHAWVQVEGRRRRLPPRN